MSPVTRLLDYIGGAIEDARSKLIDEGWFQRFPPPRSGRDHPSIEAESSDLSWVLWQKSEYSISVMEQADGRGFEPGRTIEQYPAIEHDRGIENNLAIEHDHGVDR